MDQTKFSRLHIIPSDLVYDDTAIVENLEAFKNGLHTIEQLKECLPEDKAERFVNYLHFAFDYIGKWNIQRTDYNLFIQAQLNIVDAIQCILDESQKIADEETQFKISNITDVFQFDCVELLLQDIKRIQLKNLFS